MFRRLKKDTSSEYNYIMTKLNVTPEISIKRIKPRYIVINENIFEALDTHTFMLYMAFRYEADYSKEDSAIKRSAKFMYEKAKISRRQFFISLNKLEGFGLVIRDSNTPGNSVSIYHVAQDLNYFNTECQVVHDVHASVHDMHTYHYSLPVKETNNINIISKEKCEPDKFSEQDMLADNPHAIEGELIRQWVVNRKKFPVTRIAWNRINRILGELEKLGIQPFDAFERMVASSWRGLEIKYFDQQLHSSNKPVGNQWTMDKVMEA